MSNEIFFVRGYTVVVVIVVFLLVITEGWITGKDYGNYRNHVSGAGDIWWTDVPEVEESYRKLNK